MLRFVIAIAFFCCTWQTADAAAKSTVSERIVAVKSDASVVLSASGNAAFSQVVLPDAALAQQWLAEHALQREVTVTLAAEDRYGRPTIAGDITTEMLRDGVAVIYAAQAAIPEAWRAQERAARLAKRGVWRDENFVVRPENAAQHKGRFVVFEGRVARVYESKKATYINFGDDWRTDVSITVPAGARRSMKPLLSTIREGSVVQARGVFYEENGPMLRLLKSDNLERR
jgi:micrococcal nuclease